MIKRYIFGGFLILLGGGFLLEQFNIISFSEVASLYWPIILIIIGLAGLFDKESSKFVNLILILVGTALQINNLNIVEINVFELIWPIIIILVGLMIIFSRQKNKEGSSETNNRNISSQETIDEFVVMGGVETNNRSENFKGGRITAIMGGVELDLRGAALHNNEALLEIKTFMGGVEITVPQEWRVEIKGTPILGGWSNKTGYSSDLNSPVLKIDALSMFGGIEIK